MGTSGSYTPSPKWSGTKTDVTNALGDGTPQGQDAKDILGKFTQQLAGDVDDGFGKVPSDFGHVDPDKATKKLDALLQNLPPKLATFSGLRVSGSPGRGGGGSGVGGGASSGARRSGGSKGGVGGGRRASGGTIVRPSAQRLAEFISQVPKIGLKQALTNAGLADVEKLKPDEIALAVADVLVTDASQLIMTELRDAVATVVEELCENAKSLEQAEQKLTESAGKLESVVQSLFECYIMERFKTFFCEHEAAKYGYDAADSIIKEAREFISTEMDIQREDKHDLTGVDWNGAEGAKIVDAILERTIAVYAS
jgi:chaperonin cofactor prefoldin